MTPENLRHHAAGHIAAAALVSIYEPDAAARILREVLKFTDDPKVSAPPQLREKLAAAAADPNNNLMNLKVLEMWFVDPFNSVIEKSTFAQSAPANTDKL